MAILDNEFKVLVLEALSTLLDTVEEEVGDLKDRIEEKLGELRGGEEATQLPVVEDGE
jgi:hypothetical protein